MNFNDIINILVNDVDVDKSTLKAIVNTINEQLPNLYKIPISDDLEVDRLLEKISNLPINLRIKIYDIEFDFKVIYGGDPQDANLSDFLKELLEEKKQADTNKPHYHDEDGFWFVVIAILITLLLSNTNADLKVILNFIFNHLFQ